MKKNLILLITGSLRRAINITRWMLLRAPRLIKKREDRRLLLLYDFRSQPFSVGDILVFQEAGLVLSEEFGLPRIDFAAVFDPENPTVKDPAFAHIDPESFLFHLSSILPAAQVNPRLGSLMLFDCHKALEQYVAENSDRYMIWPGFSDYASREYLFYRIFREVLEPYARRNGHLPQLHTRPAAARWGRTFLERHAKGKTAISVQLRRNPANPARDSIYDVWLQFFEHAREKYPVKFIVICGASEIDPRLRETSNVVLAKDFHTTLEQDLALIDVCAAHMGASSGPGTLALFSRKPFRMFGLDPVVIELANVLEEDGHFRFSFSSQNQLWLRDKETADQLLMEFEALWLAIPSAANT